MRSPIYRKVEGTEATELGGALVLLDASGQMLRGLNGSGALIWSLIDGVKSQADLVNVVATHFGAEPDVVAPDVEAFLAGLRERGLIQLIAG